MKQSENNVIFLSCRFLSLRESFPACLSVACSCSQLTHPLSLFFSHLFKKWVREWDPDSTPSQLISFELPHGHFRPGALLQYVSPTSAEWVADGLFIENLNVLIFIMQHVQMAPNATQHSLVSPAIHLPQCGVDLMNSSRDTQRTQTLHVQKVSSKLDGMNVGFLRWTEQEI